MIRDEILKLKLQAWIYSGVGIELEIIASHEEMKRWPTADQRRLSEGYDYEKRRMDRLQAQMKLINQRISELEAQVE